MRSASIARVLTIAGSDSGGGAGIQADLKTITALGGYGASAITALTAQNTLGVHAVHAIPADFVTEQIDAVLSDIGADAVKTGMLADAQIVEAVVAALQRHAVDNLVVDPVMVAKGGDALLSPEGEMAVRERLLPLAYVLTPNIPEAERMSGREIRTIDDMKAAAVRLAERGSRNVLVKGGHLAGDAVDVLYDGSRFHSFSAQRVQTENTHGTGCTYSAAIATYLAQGMALVEAIRSAKAYVTRAIERSLDIGQGHGPLDHAAAAQD